MRCLLVTACGCTSEVWLYRDSREYRVPLHYPIEFDCKPGDYVPSKLPAIYRTFRRTYELDDERREIFREVL